MEHKKLSIRRRRISPLLVGSSARSLRCRSAADPPSSLSDASSASSAAEHVAPWRCSLVGSVEVAVFLGLLRRVASAALDCCSAVFLIICCCELELSVTCCWDSLILRAT
ncbi:hypothetical protein QYE76_008482 [Lolium multiflorum]|uniref:Uncharacterized protein n=1 Tax=Lolium multiflorum TaxID=4521 RepID=A0AAD8TTF1_LOLMU|nr:hypothetical protein QYE76_008482 [Lolium multiflorum]